jgi:8-oxo-dGTP pyrophosphatase MutT (NUDIX family)
MDSTTNNLSHAAVLVIYHKADDCLVLTKRSEKLKSHPGEICFPGGLHEPNDESLYQTALRELEEELGIEPSRVTFVKELAHQLTLLGTIIHPWLVSIESIKPYSMNVEEVIKVISIPIESVFNPHNYEEFYVEQRGFRFKSCKFKCHDELVWGATAKIMQQLSKQKELFSLLRTV